MNQSKPNTSLEDFEQGGEPLDPGTYVHLALLRCEMALLKDNTRDGFLQYSFLVDFIEKVAVAGGMLEGETKTKLSSLSMTNEGDFNSNRLQLANQKLDVMLPDIFAQREVTAPLKIGLHPRLFQKEDEED